MPRKVPPRKTPTKPRKSKPTRKNEQHKPLEVPAKFRVGFLAELDKRSNIFKALAVRHRTIVQDLGGAGELSHVKLALIERFCWLEACLQDQEVAMASGASPKESIGRWIQGVNALVGLAKTLGLERQLKATDLRTYLADTKDPIDD